MNSPLTMSDDQILEQICSTHVDSDTKIDVHSLFTLVENTLRRSTRIVDDLVQGSHASLEHIDDKIPPFNLPLSTLKQISFEMSCKPPGGETAHKTTLAILNKLSKYEWHAKAVLTLAAFGLEYSEFWLLAQHQPTPTDPLAKSVAILKGVPLLAEPAAVEKHRQDIVEVNTLVKTTLEVMELLFELEKLISTSNTKDVPALGVAIEQIPVDVYWAIITIVAIFTQIDCLTTESKDKQELSYYSSKINIVLSKLRTHITLCIEQMGQQIKITIVEYPQYMMAPAHVRIPADWKLIFNNFAPHPLYDGATKTTIDITVLRKKNVYVFISTLDVTEQDISILRPVYDHIKIKNLYKIVWIPIVEEWTEQLRKKFEILKSKMPWYSVQYFPNTAGYKYIKEEWHFKKTSMVVVLNAQGIVQHSNAFHLIQTQGMKAFPFTNLNEEQIK